MNPSGDAAPPSFSTRKLDVLVAGGLAWTAGTKWLTQGFTWVALLILARLLSPDEFGISELASIFFGLTTVLAEFGIATTVVQMQELGRKTLSQLHTFSCIFCAGVCALSMLLLPWIAAFFHIEEHKWLIATNNLAFLIVGAQAVPMGLLQRDMDYRRLSIAEAVQVLLQSIVTLIAAFLGASYWSLTIGAGAGRLAAAVLVSVWKPVPPARPRWSELREALALGRQVAVGRVAWSAYSLSDGVIVGRVLTEGAVGSYRMAMSLAAAPAEKISTLLMRAAGPLFAKIQQDQALVRRYYLILTELLVMSVLPLMVGLALVADDAVDVVLGAQWSAAVAPLQWLALFMVFRTHRVLAELVLISQRRAQFTMRMSLLSLVLMPASFYFAAQAYGTAGVAAAWMVLTPLTVVPILWRLTREIALPVRDLFLAVWPALAGSGAMLLGVLAMQTVLAGTAWPRLPALILQVVAGGAVYATVLLLFFRGRVTRYIRFVRDLRGEKRLLAGARL